ncbi:MAG: hypothetical protein K2X01_11150 [Cyanobacteria bacterium]|nr:hypothetical protein [Cyanobacteriota bacterium]
MSISSVSLGAGGFGRAQFSPPRPPSSQDFDPNKGFSLDQLSKLNDDLKSKGVQDKNLDKTVENFKQLDADQDGKLTLSELKSGAKALGINVPSGPPPGFPPPGSSGFAGGGPGGPGGPGGLGSIGAGQGTQKYLDQLLASYKDDGSTGKTHHKHHGNHKTSSVDSDTDSDSKKTSSASNDAADYIATDVAA